MQRFNNVLLPKCFIKYLRVDEKNKVMVSDFGLARNMFDHDYYRMKNNRPKPIRWMALESILKDVYSSKSDVVSFVHSKKKAAVFSLIIMFRKKMVPL